MKTRWAETRRFFQTLVARHSEAQYRFLLNPDAEWATALPVYRDLLYQISRRLSSIPDDLASGVPRGQPHKLFKWRECDNFLQNVAAVQLGLHELRQQPEIRESGCLRIIGLPYGGIELPGIALAIANARGFKVACGLLDVSIYSDAANGDEIRRQVRAGAQEYVHLLAENKPCCWLDALNSYGENAVTIVMDDNCTSCLTLQVARDVLVTRGADVAGAVVVRFPGMNRHWRMKASGQGLLPDPNVLFSFIRGLVAPSPHIRPRQESIKPVSSRKPTMTLDKGRMRITRYLEKNGTPVGRPVSED